MRATAPSRLTAERCPRQIADDIRRTGATIGTAGLRHRVADAPSVVDTHDMIIGEHHRIAGGVVFDHQPQRADIDIAADRPAGTDADAAGQGGVGAGIDHGLQIVESDGRRMQHEFALDNVGRDPVDAVGDELVLFDAALCQFLLHIDTNTDLTGPFALGDFFTHADAGDAVELHKIAFGGRFRAPDFRC